MSAFAEMPPYYQQDPEEPSWVRCTLCNKWVDQWHEENKKHKNKVYEYEWQVANGRMAQQAPTEVQAPAQSEPSVHSTSTEGAASSGSDSDEESYGSVEAPSPDDLPRAFAVDDTCVSEEFRAELNAQYVEHQRQESGDIWFWCTLCKKYIQDDGHLISKMHTRRRATYHRDHAGPAPGVGPSDSEGEVSEDRDAPPDLATPTQVVVDLELLLSHPEVLDQLLDLTTVVVPYCALLGLDKLKRDPSPGASAESRARAHGARYATREIERHQQNNRDLIVPCVAQRSLADEILLLCRHGVALMALDESIVQRAAEAGIRVLSLE